MGLRFHVVGCSEWARAWLKKYGRQNLDTRTIENLDGMLRKGRALCCQAVK